MAAAAAAIVPLLNAGVGTVAQEMAARGGSGIYEALISRLRRDRGDRDLHMGEVQQALESALADGAVAETELATFVSVVKEIHTKVNTIGTVNAEKAYVGNVFNAQGEQHIG